MSLQVRPQACAVPLTRAGQAVVFTIYEKVKDMIMSVRPRTPSPLTVQTEDKIAEQKRTDAAIKS